MERFLRRVPPVDRLAGTLYDLHKRRVLTTVTRDPALGRAFLEGRGLPDPYHEGMDERVVEYPWVLARVPEGPARILDAGSTLNYAWLAEHPLLRDKDVVAYTLAPEGVLQRPNYTYVYGDLREIRLQDAAVDLVVCISTLEHVGMDNRAYTGRHQDLEHDTGAHLAVLAELHRVLRPGGLLLLTVPFGQAQDAGWLQQFDASGIAAIKRAFPGTVVDEGYFLHAAGRGWQWAEAGACRDARYLTRDPAGGNMETRASAVACLALEKPGP